MKGILHRLWLVLHAILIGVALVPYVMVAFFFWIATGKDIVINPPKWVERLYQ